MATIPFQPQNLTAEQSDGNILLSWSGSLSATSYQIQRSTDGVNFSNLITVGQVTQYIDPYPGIGIQYWYQIAAINGAGTSPYSSIASIVAANPGEMSLAELRLRSQQTADRVGSDFVTDSEWNAFLRLAMYELYDLLITTFDDYGISDPVYINTNGTQMSYPIPSGTNYLGNVYGGSTGTPAPRLYKISGLDLGVNTSNNAWVTLHKYDWVERNAYVYPNSTSTIYGVYNMRYRLMGTNLILIPTPAGNQQIRMWYAPVLPALLKDTDLTTIGYSGWLRYSIVRAAKYALDKEESSDTTKMDQELLFLKQRIEQSAASRDQGMPDTISNTRRDPIYGGSGFMDGGGNGGWAIIPFALFPVLPSYNIGNHLLAHSVPLSQIQLTYIALFVGFSYFAYLFRSQLSSRVLFSGTRSAGKNSLSFFGKFIPHIFKRGAKK